MENFIEVLKESERIFHKCTGESLCKEDIEILVKLNNPRIILELYKLKGLKVRYPELEEVLFSNKVEGLKYCTLFKNLRFEKFEQFIIYNKSVKYILEYHERKFSTNVWEEAEKVIVSSSPYGFYIYLSRLDRDSLKREDKERLEELLLEFNKPRLMFYYIILIEKSRVEKFEPSILAHKKAREYYLDYLKDLSIDLEKISLFAWSEGGVNLW